MPRKKAVAAAATDATPEDTSFNPAEFDPAARQQAAAIVDQVAAATHLPADVERQAAHENGHAHTPPTTASGGPGTVRENGRETAPGHIANPSSKRRESFAASARKLPGTLAVSAGDLVVEMVDAGSNQKGIGIRVVTPEGRDLTEDEKQLVRQHVRGEENERFGFEWDRNARIWHRDIVRPGEHPDDVPPMRPVAIRLDAERRVAALAESLSQHQADPAGFADRVRQQRDQAASQDRIPD